MNPEPNETSFSIVNALSILIVIGYMAAMPMWMWRPPSGVAPEILAIINQMMGAWGMAFGTVIAYHLGSSRSSKDAAKATRDTLSTLSTSVAATVASNAAAPSTNGAAPPGPAPGTVETRTTTTVAPAAAQRPTEAQAWEAALAANTNEAYRDYLRDFPTGAHAQEAVANQH